MVNVCPPRLDERASCGGEPLRGPDHPFHGDPHRSAFAGRHGGGRTNGTAVGLNFTTHWPFPVFVRTQQNVA